MTQAETATATATETKGAGMIKQLASSNAKARGAALRFLIDTWLPSQSQMTWLPSQSQISDDVMKKLWKGLFYCVWHSDKVPAQTQLINRLSSLVTQLQLPLSIHYFTAFLLTMRREWPGIDRLRLDKFYLLIRCFLRSFFALLKNNYWDLELSKRLMGVLVESMGCSESGTGNGVNYHIVSAFMEELRPFLPVGSQVLELLIGPFVSIMSKVADRVLLSKIKSNVFDELLTMGKKLLEVKKSNSEIQNDDDVVVLGTIALAFGFSTKLYESGSSLECCQGNRKVLFSLHEEFSKLEKALAASGIQISLSEQVNGDDEVPILVPLANGMDVDGANVIPKKKKKKEKEKEKEKKKKSKSDKANKKGMKNKNVVNSNHHTGNDDHSEHEAVLNGDISMEDTSGHDVNPITFDESAISNLQMQFEKVAAEVGMDVNVDTARDSLKLNGNGATVPKKRKRAKSMGENIALPGGGEAEAASTAKSNGSVKRVRFSMKNNLVWKPHNPLPPQSLRIPPSVTPRGSALKQGIPPGPIREMPTANKKLKKRAKSIKKGQKGVKRISHLKLKSLSA